ncbi:hypothetical protein KO500_07360 [Cellulophaga baltica]|nr:MULTISPECIES: hypothetical protein [Cellulophaga]MBU2996246.1 hypothetical protein [Cellulophaga baltica]MDO6767641.1 hypothetical protein [Cellulophaga sp. 1_MG-2023]
MTYLSPQIEALAKRKKENSLIKKENSCGIFQDYGNDETIKEEQTEI